MDPAGIGKKIKELYPQYGEVDDAMLGQKYLQKHGAAISGIQSGQLNMADIPQAQRQAVSVGLEGVGYEAPEDAATAAETKKEDSFNASVNLINELEQKFTDAKGGEYTGLGAIIGGTKKNIAGKLNLDKGARIYNRTKEGFTAALKDLTGDVGVLTDKDYERISSLLPKFTDDPEVAKELFNTLRSQMASKYGGEKTQTQYQQPEVKGGALASVVPGLTQMGKETAQDPALMKILETGLPIAQLRRPSGRKGAGEVLTALGLTNLAKSGASKLKGLTKGGALRNRAEVAAKTTEKISGDAVYKKAKTRVLKTVSETDKKTAVKLLKEAKTGLKGKNFSAQTALDKLAQYNKAYTTTGRAGKSAKAAVNDALSKAMRSELPKKVLEAQGQLRTAMGLGKNVRRGVGYTSLAAGGTAGVGYLLNLLRGKK